VDRDTIVCFCEDITEEEIIKAIEQGYTQPLEIKQHLRVGMGACRGRGCSLQIMRLISRTTGKPMDKIIPFTARPPLTPLPLGLWMKINE
jgi:bacterioferritin-associated ferredoxin